MSVFGTSPPYLQLCEDSGASPRAQLSLPALRSVLSTGSILHDTQYDWAREHIGNLPLQSISGGTDIIGCFVLGNPDLPVRRGMLQCVSLGLDVQALTLPRLLANSVGELICRNPFPSRPLGFVGDDGSRFHATYFDANLGGLDARRPDLLRCGGSTPGCTAARTASSRSRAFGSGPRRSIVTPSTRSANCPSRSPSEQRGRAGDARVALLVVLRDGLHARRRADAQGIRRAIGRNLPTPLHTCRV